ncbi:NAD(P)/FAD-dependent oxidoreductase [Enterococcus bulliens]
MKKIAIIGGGIIGAVTAYYLTKANYAVEVYDEGIGQATKASAGIIAPWLSKRRNKKWYALAKDGAAFYAKFVHDLALDETIYHQTGALLVRPKDKLESLAELAQTRRKEAPEIGDITLLDPTRVSTIFPLLNAQAALMISGGAKLNGHALLIHLYRQIEANGGKIIHKKAHFKKNTTGYQVMTDTTTSTVELICLTSGPRVKELLAPLEYHVDIRPQKGQLIVFETDLATKHLPVALLDGEADLIPLANGKILLGATHENDAKYDLTPTSEAFTNLTQSIARFLSSPEGLFNTPYRYQVGTRAYTSDFAPFFDQLPHEEIFVASGLGSSGLTTGPLIGYLLAQKIQGQSLDLTRYQKPLDTYITKS